MLPPRQWQNRIVGHGEEDAAQLLANPRNWRIHPKRQQDAIAGVLSKIGWVQDVIVNQRTGFVVDGHARVALAISAGERVPVVYVDLSEEEEAAVLATFDPLGAMAGKDDEIFKDLVAGMDDAYAALAGQAGASITPVSGEDDAPEPPAAPVSVLGDLWACGEHRVLCGDSTSVDAVERLMDGQQADMVFTDPPYGMDLDTDFSSEKSNLRMLKEKGLKGGRSYSAVVGDSVDFDPRPLIALFAGCKEQFWWGADYYAERIPGKNDGSWVVWDKRLDESADRMYGSCFETCWSREKHKREIARVKWAGVFGTEHEPSLDGKKRVHPTQKPIVLVCWFFERWGTPGDIVLDPFLGSGSTLIACEKTGRICYGLELAPEYIDVIVKRWQDFTGKEATLADGPYKGSTFAKVKEGRFKKACDEIMEEAIVAGA